jgi:hypothetical protein
MADPLKFLYFRPIDSLVESKPVSSKPSSQRVWAARSFLVFWAVAATAASSVLVSYHQPFRQPLELHIDVPRSPGWNMVHILAADCGCSLKVMECLVRRRPIPSISEWVFVIRGADTLPLEARLAAAGYAVRALSAENASRWGIRAVPLLTIEAPDGKLVYAGGYGSGRDGGQMILSRVRAGAQQAPLPLFGCAVGHRLRRQVDPFALKFKGLE